MRKFIYIFCALLAYLVFSSRSCVPEAHREAMKKAQIKKEKQEIRDQFGSDRLSEETLIAFEEKARQKLIDLSDYLNIYFDDSMDDTFRNQAQQMIKTLFIDDNTQINSLLTDKDGKRSYKLDKFFKKDPGSGADSIRFIIDSIEVSEHFHRSDEYLYDGKLTFHRYLEFQTATDTFSIDSTMMEADIILSKSNKIFGIDTLMVWGVHLGDIR